MKVYNTNAGLMIQEANRFQWVPDLDWDAWFLAEDPFAVLRAAARDEVSSPEAKTTLETSLLAPMGSQEVWAAGVTYYRSRDARMEESKKAGGSDFYDKVYDAERPELFFKATADRVVAPGGTVRVRADSEWDVPEPEVILGINATGNIIGYTLGNDMSSRSIEGENPLYLPQAKVYDGSAAVGPCLVPAEGVTLSDWHITMSIVRRGQETFKGETSLDQLKRSPEELVSYLYRECSFHRGCYLMTGTGIVPDRNFTLQSGDRIEIGLDEIGLLVNTVQ